MFILEHIDTDDLVMPTRPTIFQVIGGLLLLAPLVAMALVILEESGRPRATVPAKRVSRSRTRTKKQR